MDETQLSARIGQAAADPAIAIADGVTAQDKPLSDLIKADCYLQGITALSGLNTRGGQRSAWACTRPARVIPPGGSVDLELAGPYPYSG